MFPVEIWGDVATWVGSVGTSGAAIAAATFFIYDKRVEAGAQASLVRAVRKSPYGKKFVATVSNNSDRPIATVVVVLRPMKAREYFLRRDMFADSDNEEPKKLTLTELLDRDPRDLYVTDSADCIAHIQANGLPPDDIVKAGESIDIEVPGEFRNDWIYYVSFTDQRGKHWFIDIDVTERARRYSGPLDELLGETRRERIQRLYRTRWADRRRRQKIDRWLARANIR